MHRAGQEVLSWTTFIGVLYVFKYVSWDFPGGPVAKTPTPSARVQGSIPGQRTRYATTKTQCSQINNFL